jgi:hypothetical protein
MQLRDLLDLVNERAGELARSDVHHVWRLQCWQSTETILSSGQRSPGCCGLRTPA